MGDALLPVEMMIEDKAGWGLTPGLQRLLHRHSTPLGGQLLLRRGWAGLGCAGLGWAGRAELTTHQLRQGKLLSNQASGAKQGKGHVFHVAPFE